MSSGNVKNQVSVTGKYVTLFILVVLLAQAGAVFFRTGSHLWPFTNYPMYATAHFENERLDSDYKVFAVFPDGSEHLIDEQDIVGDFNRSGRRDFDATVVANGLTEEVVPWPPCALDPSGSCVLFRKFLVKNILSFPADEFTLGSDTNIFPASLENESWLRRLLKPVVSRRHIANRQLELFTLDIEENLSRTITAFRVEDYPAKITRYGWSAVEAPQTLKVLAVAR